MELNNEKNEINNMRVESRVCEAAVSILLRGNVITEDEIDSIEIEFGYIFTKENKELEGLLKVITPKGDFYMALQNGQLTALKFNEDLYKDTINKMKSMHPCLNEDNSKSHNDINSNGNFMDQIRIKNNELIRSLNITVNENLVNDVSGDIKKSLDQICKRALASLITIQIACDINNGNYQKSLDYFKPFLEEFSVSDSLNEKEKRIIDGTYTSQDALDMDGAYEAYWALCWALGLVDDITDASRICNCDEAINFVFASYDYDDFKNICNLRTKEEIVEMQDLYYRYNWAINNKQIDSSTSIGYLDPDIVIERRRALEWILSSEEDWYNVNMSA